MLGHKTPKFFILPRSLAQIFFIAHTDHYKQPQIW